MLQNKEVKELFTLERTIVQTAWMLNATRQLAELAAAFAALFFYLSDAFYTDVPFYLGYLHFFVYLGQGLFLLWKSERWVAGWSDRKRSWWRQAVAVLGWPMHYSLVVFHQKVHRFDEAHPPQHDDRCLAAGKSLLFACPWRQPLVLWFVSSITRSDRLGPGSSSDLTSGNFQA